MINCTVHDNASVLQSRYNEVLKTASWKRVQLDQIGYTLAAQIYNHLIGQSMGREV